MNVSTNKIFNEIERQMTTVIVLVEINPLKGLDIMPCGCAGVVRDVVG